MEVEGFETPQQTLRDAAELIEERGRLYGDAKKNFGRIARIASTILGKEVSRYDVATILLAVKLGRVPEDPAYGDNYDDGINYLAFMKMFRTESK